MTSTTKHEGFEVRFLWAGDPWFDIHVRRAAPQGGDWVLYSHLHFPLDPSGLYVIDFRPEVFAPLVEAFLRHQFDSTKAKAKLANA